MNISELVEPIERNTVLNPKLWDHNKLKPEVRGALVRIAEDFVKFCEVPMRVLDIVLYGGNANYNYTSMSDIDLHLIVDKDGIECERAVDELFDSKRRLYKAKYNIEIRGIPVELYVESPDETPVSSSYSLTKDQWIKEPDPNMPEWDRKAVAGQSELWRIILQGAMRTGDLQTCRKAVELLRQYRKVGLRQPNGEFSVPNLVFKSLRNDQTISGMMALIDRLHDQELSLNH